MSLRRVRLSAAMSLDGFIATEDGGYDWIPMDPDIDFGALFAGYDTILMGRKSYEDAQRAGHLAMYGAMRILVCSRTLRPEEHPAVTVIRDPAPTVHALRAAPGKDLWLFGGGELLRSCLDRDLVDELELAIVPVLLGAGRPLLPGGALHTRLRLLGHRLYPRTGTLLCRYAVERASRGAAG